MKRFASIFLGAALALVSTMAFAAAPPVNSDGYPVFSSERLGLSYVYQHAKADPTAWTYAGATGGLTTTTAVTVKTAVTGKKIYVRAIQYANGSTGTGEIEIRCGAAGTVLWRGYVGPSAVTMGGTNFATPLQCTAGTLVEVALTSGTSMAVRISLQGGTEN